MACDTRLKPRQTIQERAVEVREATVRLAAALAAGRVQVKIGANGVPVFTGWDEQSRDGITDACAYRRIMATGSPTTKAELARAELMSGRSINRQVIGQGVHSHDGGVSWHTHRK